MTKRLVLVGRIVKRNGKAIRTEMVDLDWWVEQNFPKKS